MRILLLIFVAMILLRLARRFGLGRGLSGLFDRLTHRSTRGDAFRDHVRRRTLPFRAYEPEGVTGPAPVVIFSHGLGGTRDAAPYLGRALAAAGYWGIFLQHPGSDRAVMQGAGSRDEAMGRLMQSMTDPTNMRDRFLDLPFVLDELARLNAAPRGRFAGRLDLARLGMGGHSYGSRSVMAAAGQAFGGMSFRDPRIRAGLLLSPSAARRPGAARQNPAADFADIDMPLFHVTGTRDGTGPGGGKGGGKGGDGGDPAARTLPWQMITAPEQYLMVFDGATHGDFSGAGRDETPPDSRYTRSVALGAVLFFDAFLKGDDGAWSALREEFPTTLEPGDRFEFK